MGNAARKGGQAARAYPKPLSAEVRKETVSKAKQATSASVDEALPLTERTIPESHVYASNAHQHATKAQSEPKPELQRQDPSLAAAVNKLALKSTDFKVPTRQPNVTPAAAQLSRLKSEQIMQLYKTLAQPQQHDLSKLATFLDLPEEQVQSLVQFYSLPQEQKQKSSESSSLEPGINTTSSPKHSVKGQN
eukprot:m.8426 g.8426  ORF g.8426 m.8426 type:complete len:191 (+) comp6969_c0_seq1:50-622(+)